MESVDGFLNRSSWPLCARCLHHGSRGFISVHFSGRASQNAAVSNYGIGFYADMYMYRQPLQVHVYFVPVLQEYCQEETFIATCDVNEVIEMETALYGRMRPGGCISSDLGHTGCYAPVLNIFDKQCSGKEHCSMQVLNENIRVDVPCHSQLIRYLQASYSCLPGIAAPPILKQSYL